jgi:serine/threonine protein kinase
MYLNHNYLSVCFNCVSGDHLPRKAIVNEDLLGTALAGSQIIALIGQGGMASVYRAYQEHLEREVAIKVLPLQSSTDPLFIERFQLEARAMAKLRHPHIVTIYDAGEQEGHLYIVMEYVSGGNLRQRMEQSMKISEAAHIFHDVAEALAYAHERGIVHRDVKPANVLLDTTSHQRQWPRAVLTDFGIAKVMETTNTLQPSGMGVGTPEYMSPEQCQGQIVDPRSDIYSLGVMLYEMLCGQPPFVGETFDEIAQGHIRQEVLPPTVLNSQVNGAIQAVVLTALQKRPEQRFQSAMEMARALTNALNSSQPRPMSRPLNLACPHCQYLNPSGMNFCAKCGTHLRGGPPATLPPTFDLPPVTCLNCGASNSGINRHCTHCGARLASVICVNCGRSNAAGQQFCSACSQPLPGNR